jgi:thioredoxin-related protein
MKIYHMKKTTFLLLSMLLTMACIAQKPEPVSTILPKAFKQAIRENKNVFVIFHASWCGWCKKLDASLNDPKIKKYFDTSYVIVHFTVQESAANKKLETPGADAILNKYGGKDAGLPFFVIFNNYGEVIGDSFYKNENMGCPASENEVTAFIDLLKKSSTINEEGLALINTRFRKNETAK